MNNEKQFQDLAEIRRLMEKSSSFVSLSGLSGVFAGIYAIVGAFAAIYTLTGSFNMLNYLQQRVIYLDNHNLLILISIAITVLVLSLGTAIFFSQKKAEKHNLPKWDRVAFRMMISLLIPLVTGGIFCLILLYHSLFSRGVGLNYYALIAPSTLLFYGLALLNASKYTLVEIKWFGISQIILGLLGTLFLGYGIFLWIIGFGLLHIIYGAVMWFKYER